MQNDRGETVRVRAGRRRLQLVLTCSRLPSRCYVLAGQIMVNQQLVRSFRRCIFLWNGFWLSLLIDSTQRLDREVKVWKPLRHPNVLPFWGISREFGPFPALISPYCPSRDAVSYLRNHPEIDKWPIVRSPISIYPVSCPLTRRYCKVFDLTAGLNYLHSQQVVHGDLKGVRTAVIHTSEADRSRQQQSNLLIGATGQGLLCDFGVSRIIGSPGFTTAIFGTPPFMAPELFPDLALIDEDASDDETESFCPEFTKETDVYAYGLTLLQVCDPFHPRQPRPPACSNAARSSRAKLPSPSTRPRLRLTFCPNVDITIPSTTGCGVWLRDVVPSMRGRGSGSTRCRSRFH